ncbi:protein serine/threonine phosphatase 2C [Multifurca ochricompacta]|uniref:Protein serine/threonine phosphatase 2C n=1 Tax=Multifurca ochricompacta TaxID=376703 RepID=A0AAD4MAY3_9AGAM|nr:protein serine/threonine phosphatase 2C [Multifurca ochricompacta]
MFNRAWKPILGAAVVGAPSAYIYYRYTESNKYPTFTINVKDKGPDGKASMVKRSFPLLSKAAVDQRINESATLTSQPPSQGLVWKHTTAHLSSNNPIEDAHAQAVITTEATSSDPARNLLFYAVMDGHAGFNTSRLLSHVLIPAVVLELTAFAREADASAKTLSVLDILKSPFSFSPQPGMTVPRDKRVERVSQAIQRAFYNVDFEIINGPLRVLAANVSKLDNANTPDLSQHPMAEASMLPALSGSCALMAFLDPSRQDLYVACTGDSRAVAGIWEESEDGTGKWRVEVLSEDQTGRNPNEIRRIQSEHPASEAEDVISRGRILGGLEPSRAFGDARYKWPREVQETLYKAFIAGAGKAMRPAPPALKTPPYVIATPVVTHRKLSLPKSGLPKEKSTSLKFLILATDGLWDELSSEEVVSLVGGYFSGLKGTVSKASLQTLVPTTSGSATVQGKEQTRGNARQGSWAFVDDNVSAHLIRNAFGGGDEDELRKILSIPAPHSRRWRDDVTVTVVWWEEAQESSLGKKAKL